MPNGWISVRIRCEYCDKLKWYPSEITQDVVMPKKKGSMKLQSVMICRKCLKEKTGRER